MQFNTQDFYNLYRGGNAVLNNARYLQPIKLTEPPEDYRKRLNEASYNNLAKQIIKIYSNYITGNGINIDRTVPNTQSEVNEPFKDVEIKNTIKDIIKHTLVGGFCIVVFHKDDNGQSYRLFTPDKLKEKKKGVWTFLEDDKEIQIQKLNNVYTVKDGETVTQMPESLVGVFKMNSDYTGIIHDVASLLVKLFNIESILQSHFSRSLNFLLYLPSTQDAQGLANLSLSSPVIHGEKGDVTPAFITPSVEILSHALAYIDKVIKEVASNVSLKEELSGDVVTSNISGRAKQIEKIDIQNTIKDLTENIVSTFNDIQQGRRDVYSEGAMIQIDASIDSGDSLSDIATLRNISSFINEPNSTKEIKKLMIQRLDLPLNTERELIKQVESSEDVENVTPDSVVDLNEF